MTQFTQQLQEFNQLSESQQWQWALDNKASIQLYLDNDSTNFTFNDEDKSEDCTFGKFKADIGNREGAGILLEALGFSFEYA
jgi:hypothetical protein